MTKEKCSIEKLRFFMDITYKYYHKINQSNKQYYLFQNYHQNIRGSGKKPCEVLSHWHPDFPHVLRLRAHYLMYSQVNNVHIENYNLGVYYGRQIHEKGGLAIYVHNSLCFSNTDIVKHCKEKDREICVLKLSFGILNIRVLTLYRAPSGTFSHFILKLDTILQLLYTPTLHIVIGGDRNSNYLMGGGNPTRQFI
jgi:hypothetical protein